MTVVGSGATLTSMSAARHDVHIAVTQEQFHRFVSARDWSADHSKVERLYSRIVVTPPPAYPHSKVIRKLILRLGEHVESRKLGELFESSQGYVLPSGDSVVPDLSFVSSARWSTVRSPEGVSYLPVVPDLVVEVLSRSNAASDRGPKKDIYEANGVGEYWLVDPRAREIVVFVRDEARGAFREETVFRGAERVRSAVVDGFEVAVSDVVV